MGRPVAIAVALALLACASDGGSPTASGGSSSGGGLPDSAALAAVPSRVLLVSVAGLLPDHYRRAGLAGGREPVAMRHLALLGERGVFADGMQVVNPAAVLPVHATLVTGRPPAEHGIVADRLLGARGVRAARFEHASRLRGPSLWQAAKDAGKSVASLGWPTTTGAAIDFLVPDVEPERGERWLDAIEGSATPWLVERLVQRAPKTPDARWPRAAERDALMVDLACDIARSQALPALWMIRLEGGASAQLAYGPGTTESWRAFVAVDQQLARLTACLSRAGLLDSSALVVVGDRAVRPVHTRLDPNVALATAGLVQLSDRTGIESWVAISRSSGGTALVYAQGEDDAIAARRALGVAARESGALQVVSAATLRERGADPRAWFGIDAAPGFLFGNSVTGPLARASELRGVGGYPADEPGSDVGFVAWGPGLRSSVRVSLLRQLDVAPTVASLLGIRLPEVQGRALLGALVQNPSELSPAALR